MTTNVTQISTALADAFAAVGAGEATVEQTALHEAALAVFANNLDDSVISTIATQAGPFAVIYDAPYSELSALQRWIRDAAAEADRELPSLGDMGAVYEALIAASDSSGPALRLAHGVNIIGLDAQRRRWLVPSMARRTIDAALVAPDAKSAHRVLRAKGAVRFHWSIERTFLVPDPVDIAERLPLPQGGCYLVCYAGSTDIVTKKAFRDALVKLGQHQPVPDLLIWDTEGEAALWSLRGAIGHTDGEDHQWPDAVRAAAESLAASLWPG